MEPVHHLVAVVRQINRGDHQQGNEEENKDKAVGGHEGHNAVRRRIPGGIIDPDLLAHAIAGRACLESGVVDVRRAVIRTKFSRHAVGRPVGIR